MSREKITRDVLDLLIRPVVDGIDVDGDCGSNFSIDGVPIGLNQECNANFNDVDVIGTLDAMSGLNVSGGDLDMGTTGRIVNMADGVGAQDAITLSQANALFVNVSGDTMAGVLSMGGNKITNLATPSAGSTEAANAAYVDNAVENAPGGFDSGQTMQDVTSSRTYGTLYTNSSGYVLWVTVAINISSSGQARLVVDGIGVTESDFDTVATNDWIWHACLVPPGGTYELQLLTGSISTERWTEYRFGAP